ncbi:MAG: penicillin-binding transpeptidase domain-containing protein, partial [Acutalibacteraceae bacterium]
MKRTLRRSILTFILALACIGALVYFAFQLVINCNDWVQQPYNGHMGGAKGLAQAGAIYDRNGEVLAKTVDGERVYNEDKTVRKALLHVVGDDSLNISTAVQSMYRTELTGYSFIWGLGMPSSLRSNNDITLTIDSNVSRDAYEALGDKSGACVIYNYKTGEVICSVSTKSYDPNSPPKEEDLEKEEYSGVYLDNCMSSSYTPGSIFKIVTSAVAIEKGIIKSLDDRSYYCNGSDKIGGKDDTSIINCYNKSAHGGEDFKTALAESCNLYFGELATEVGNEDMQEMADKMGINTSYDVSNIPTKKGNYDVKDANENQLAWSGVGQYNDQVNPMQMAVICGAIANGGTPVN